MSWERTVIYQSGACPRLTYHFPFGPAYVELHDPACRQVTKAAPGWWLTCRDLGINKKLEAESEEAAKQEARALLAQRLEAV